MRIPLSYLRHLLLRGTILWLLARLSAPVVAGVAGAQVESGLILSFWAIAITAALVLVDLQRRKELMLLHNLGVTTIHPVLVGTIPAATIEILLGVLR